MGPLRVVTIRTFPVHGAAGVDHVRVQVGETGLVGDRPKKAAVSLVGTDAPATRANLVLDAPTELVEALAGTQVRIGGALLAVRVTGTSCPGLYAAVDEAGSIGLGDAVEPG